VAEIIIKTVFCLEGSPTVSAPPQGHNYVEVSESGRSLHGRVNHGRRKLVRKFRIDKRGGVGAAK